MAVQPKDEIPAVPAAPAGPEPTREMIEVGMQSIDAAAAMARQHVATMLAVAQVAAKGFEAISSELSTFSRESFERTTTAAKAMTATTTPKALLEVQADYARQHGEAAIAHLTKMSEAMFGTMRESLARSADR